jgi:hypothetical protein
LAPSAECRAAAARNRNGHRWTEAFFVPKQVARGLGAAHKKKSALSAESRPRECLIPRLPTCYPELALPTPRTSGTIDLARSDLCFIEHKFPE